MAERARVTTLLGLLKRTPYVNQRLHSTYLVMGIPRIWSQSHNSRELSTTITGGREVLLNQYYRFRKNQLSGSNPLGAIPTARLGISVSCLLKVHLKTSRLSKDNINDDSYYGSDNNNKEKSFLYFDSYSSKTSHALDFRCLNKKC